MRKRNFMFLTVLLVLALNGCGKEEKAIDVTEALTLRFSGVSGSGTAEIEDPYSWEKEALAATNIDEIDSFSDLGDAFIIESAVSYDISPKENLSNGDEVTVSVKIDNETIEKYDIKFIGEEKKFIVEGLSEIHAFECKEEIKNASPEDGLVQIDDMLFRYGSSVSEAIEMIESSTENYTFKNPYNENELVPAADPVVQIILLKNDDWYFELVANNLTEETISLKDCIITRITAYGASKGNVYYAGFNTDNEMITYNDVKEIMKNYEVVREQSEYNNKGEKFICVEYDISSELGRDGMLYVFFVFESGTGEFDAFSINRTNNINIPT